MDKSYIDENKLSQIKDFVEDLPGGFFVYKADESEEMLYANKVMGVHSF